MDTTTKPRIVKAAGVVWHCRSAEYWGVGVSMDAAYRDWCDYMRKIGKVIQ